MTTRAIELERGMMSTLDRLGVLPYVKRKVENGATHEAIVKELHQVMECCRILFV